MDLQEVGGSRGDWMELAEDRDRWRALVSTVMNLRVPKNAGNFLTSCRTSELLKKDSAPWSKYVIEEHLKSLCSELVSYEF